jgi:dicarboxylate transporter 10
MQGESRLPMIERKYKNVLHGLITVSKSEGIISLWRGVGPNIQRAIVVTCSQFVSYDFFKRTALQQFGLADGFITHLLASCAAGVVVAMAASPGNK